MKTYIIVGFSAAGLGVISKLRQLDDDAKIICISEQKYLPYNKCLMADYICGAIDDKRLFCKDLNFFKENNIELLLSKKVTKIISDKNQIRLNDDQLLTYDKLFLGLGTDPFIPDFEGVNTIKDVFNFHTLKDAQNISKFIKENNVNDAVVIGSALSALEIADTLCNLGIKVTLLCRSNKILRSYLDQKGSDFIEKIIIKFGINLLKNVSVKKVIQDKDRRFEITFDDSKKINTGMVIFATGQKPNIELAKDSGIKTQDSRIVVNKKMQTSITNIFAGGDVCLVNDIVTNQLTPSCTWPDAVLQGMVAVSNMAGKEKLFPGVLTTISSNIFGMPFICCGSILNPPQNSDFIIKESDKFYHKFLIQDKKLIAFLMMGKLEDVGNLKTLILSKKSFI